MKQPSSTNKASWGRTKGCAKSSKISGIDHNITGTSWVIITIRRLKRLSDYVSQFWKKWCGFFQQLRQRHLKRTVFAIYRTIYNSLCSYRAWYWPSWKLFYFSSLWWAVRPVPCYREATWFMENSGWTQWACRKDPVMRASLTRETLTLIKRLWNREWESWMDGQRQMVMVLEDDVLGYLSVTFNAQDQGWWKTKMGL